MKKPTESLNSFTEQGMDAIKTQFSKPRDQLQSMITVPTAVYENLLRNALYNFPLFTGKTNGQDRPIRYDPTTRLFFSQEDGRLLIPIKLIEEQLKQPNIGPMSNLGAEISRQAQAGKANGAIFKYDDRGRYLGVEINGKVMKPEDAHKPYDSKTCQVCQAPSTAKCGVCKSVNYCGAICQKADWPTHKADCQEMKVLREMMPH